MTAKPKRKAIFLDRDGVLNELVDRKGAKLMSGRRAKLSPPFTVEEVRFKPEVVHQLIVLGRAGYLRIVVTNQSDVASGQIPMAEFERIKRHFLALPIDDYFACLHAREAGCECRKPKPTLLLEAAAKHDIDLAKSWTVGDLESDVGAGIAAGTRTILLPETPEAAAHTKATHCMKHLGMVALHLEGLVLQEQREAARRGAEEKSGRPNTGCYTPKKRRPRKK